ncbi:hypothetical protein ARMGADRAFT_453494 [Armillaria gallica]|uniref:Secreted protein n=1 Tax=Armillaria gallica TaxID=47427 RepID=A0A2H3DA60_ARMGA|nr:hypothetical protein ARMGADRAFT_453494 [Armillaria gallica]
MIILILKVLVSQAAMSSLVDCCQNHICEEWMRRQEHRNVRDRKCLLRYILICLTLSFSSVNFRNGSVKRFAVSVGKRRLFRLWGLHGISITLSSNDAHGTPRTPETALPMFQRNDATRTISQRYSRHDHFNYTHNHIEFNVSVSCSTESTELLMRSVVNFYLYAETRIKISFMNHRRPTLRTSSVG